MVDEQTVLIVHIRLSASVEYQKEENKEISLILMMTNLFNGLLETADDVDQ